MFEFMEHPEHARYWDAALKGKKVAWDELFEGYQATVDWPGCTFYQELMAQYPDAKVLLSVRDPERWYKSASETIFTASRGGPRQLWQLLSTPRMWRSIWVVIRLIPRRTFSGKEHDKAHAIGVFKAHIEEVKRVVPPERLLVYEVKEGWEPLCRFLGVGRCPSRRFRTSTTPRRFKKICASGFAEVLPKQVEMFCLVCF